MKLERPIIFFDLESTGLDTQEDRIIEMCMIKLHPDGSKETKTRRINPTIPISPGASEVHGIHDADVENEPTFKQMAKGIHEFIQGCDIAGYNSNAYDCPMLYAEFARAGIDWDYKQHKFIDVGNIFKIHQQRTLEAALLFYCNRELDGALNAENDVNATIDVFMAQQKVIEGFPETVEDIEFYSNYDRPILDLSGKFTSDKEGNILLNFGKYRGESANEHLDFLEWMAYKANFPKDTTEIALSILNNN